MTALERLREMAKDSHDAAQIVEYLELLPMPATREEFLIGCICTLIESGKEKDKIWAMSSKGPVTLPIIGETPEIETK